MNESLSSVYDNCQWQDVGRCGRERGEGGGPGDLGALAEDRELE